MDLFVASPDWGWWIIAYFYLGGIAAGAYFFATLIDLLGHESDREVARIGYWIAFPLVSLCGLILIADLYRPERFWHMLFKSEVVHEALAEGWPGSGQGWRTISHAFLFKYWSPMSAGAWGLALFGFCASLSFLGSLRPNGRLAWLFRFGLLGKILEVVGCLTGFFIASYTGALLTATNQPFWSDSDWIAPLFLASSASTGIAAMIFIARLRKIPIEELWHLERADLWAICLELVVFAIFLASLGALLGPLWHTVHGKLLVVGVLLIGLLLPLALHLGSFRPSRTITAAALVLLGGLVLRYAVITAPPEMLEHAQEILAQLPEQPIGTPGRPWLPGFSPEDGRQPGGGPGADPGNRRPGMEPRSKVFDDRIQ
jgi:protein NrfD